MKITEISYENYRNIAKVTLYPDAGVNILWGNNAQGKTNALEGMYHFAAGKSFRGVKDREIISFEKNTAMLSMKYQDERRENSMKMQFFADKKKQMVRNGVSIKRTADFVGYFHCVLFCPEHLQLIKGSPSLRRDFLDGAICQLKPAYTQAIIDYQRLLKQKNALLKNDYPEKNKPLFEVLVTQLATINAQILFSRLKYIQLLQEQLDTFLSDMTDGREHAKMQYCSDLCEERLPADRIEAAAQYYEKTMSNFSREIAAKTTLVGCHRDDVQFLINGREAKKYASQGQDRSLALAMKLGEGELCRIATGEYPVFLFDDVLSELDRERQSYLMGKLGGRQVILTSCNEELFHDQDISMIHVKNGTYQKE